MITIRPPSVQRLYDEFWSGDPAFVQLGTSASDDDRQAHEAKWKRARETGNFSELLIEGQTPTKFVMQIIKGDQWRWLVDQSTRTDEHRMGMAMFWHLIFRCACVRVEGANFADKPVKHANLGHIAPPEIANALDQADPSIVTELASVAFERSRRLDPL